MPAIGNNYFKFLLFYASEYTAALLYSQRLNSRCAVRIGCRGERKEKILTPVHLLIFHMCTPLNKHLLYLSAFWWITNVPKCFKLLSCFWYHTSFSNTGVALPAVPEEAMVFITYTICSPARSLLWEWKLPHLPLLCTFERLILVCCSDAAAADVDRKSVV